MKITASEKQLAKGIWLFNDNDESINENTFVCGSKDGGWVAFKFDAKMDWPEFYAITRTKAEAVKIAKGEAIPSIRGLSRSQAPRMMLISFWHLPVYEVFSAPA